MEFIYCVLYLIISGIIVFFIGRIVPRKWIFENKFPFKSFKFEKNGKIYEKLKVQKWKTKLPDASVIINKIVPGFMPIKRMKIKSKEYIKILEKESCIAEINHVIVSVLGLLCMRIWKKTGGKIISIAYILFNIPFIIIQRYNRPRLNKLANSL